MTVSVGAERPALEVKPALVTGPEKIALLACNGLITVSEIAVRVSMVVFAKRTEDAVSVVAVSDDVETKPGVLNPVPALIVAAVTLPAITVVETVAEPAVVIPPAVNVPVTSAVWVVSAPAFVIEPVDRRFVTVAEPAVKEVTS